MSSAPANVIKVQAFEILRRVKTHDNAHGREVLYLFPNPGMIHVIWDGDDYISVLSPCEIQADDVRI